MSYILTVAFELGLDQAISRAYSHLVIVVNMTFIAYKL